MGEERRCPTSGEETPEERVDSLDDSQVRELLARLVATVEAHGAPAPVVKELRRWSLVGTPAD